MKTQRYRSAGRPGLTTSRRHRGLWAAGVALALAFPAAAHPYDLAQLLAMPLERLLALKITSRGGALFAAPRAPALAGHPTYGGDHAP
jgi:hypothetical protein